MNKHFIRYSLFPMRVVQIATDVELFDKNNYGAV